MKNLERDRRRKKGAIGSQDGGFRTFERRTRGADGRSATCILEEGWKRMPPATSSVYPWMICTSCYQTFDLRRNFVEHMRKHKKGELDDLGQEKPRDEENVKNIPGDKTDYAKDIE